MTEEIDAVAPAETKHIDAAFELKRLAGDGAFEGHASVFGVRDAYDDVVLPGAFTRTVRERGPRGVKMLWQHNARQPIGVWEEIEEDETGLFVKGRLALGTQAGREAHELLRMGAIEGLSIGYSTVNAETGEEEGVRKLGEVDLWEISLVTFPANPAARVEAVKAPPHTIRTFERFLRDAGFSHSEARAIAAGGFKWTHVSQRDADDGLDELVASLRRAAGVLAARGAEAAPMTA